VSNPQHTSEELQQRIRRLESQVEVLRRELDAIAYAVSHDLRAPLRSIAGYCQVLQEEIGATLSDEHRHYMERIQDAAARLSQQIDALLELSRAARAELLPRELDVSQYVSSAINELPDRPQNLQLQVQPDMRTWADPRALQVILRQLLSNAIKCSAERDTPRVEITQTAGDETTVLCVADNGVGFDPKYADKLFTPFQRLHADRRLSGTGIGLALVQRLVAQHGGRVWAKSEPGAGARFYVELPLQAPGG
jgi:signal transduction histidine kinase